MCRLRGDSYRLIAQQLGLAYSTVRNIVFKFQETGSVKNKPRCGGPQKLKAEDVEMLKHDVLEDRESQTMPLFDITMKLNNILHTKPLTLVDTNCKFTELSAVI